MNARLTLVALSASVLLACAAPAARDGGADGSLNGSNDGGTCVDEDNDGHPSAACGGDDCDDRNPRVNPSVREVCDNLGVDEDCDPCTVAQTLVSGRGGDGDLDEDGFASSQCFNRVRTADAPMCGQSASFDGGARVARLSVSATEVRGTDCADDAANGATRFPGATEQCNNVDDNCDGEIDEGVSVRCYPDVDGDGFAPTGSALSRACPSSDPGRVRDFGGCPPGTTNRAPSAGAADCNDGMGGNSVFPGAMERCNNADDNCDGAIDEGDPEAGASCVLMSMGSDPGVCRNEARLRCVGGTLQCAQGVRPGERREMCNALDDDCDGVADESFCVDATVDALGRQSAPTGYGSCAGTTCTIARCVDGRGDCNGRQIDGCEASLRDDANHCGACGVRCPFGASCVAGLCARQTWTAVRTGGSYSCLLNADGRVFCWGNNDAGQFGDGTMTTRVDPVAVTGVTDAVEISLGGIHACARRRSGEVLCWGSNATGRLGDGTADPRSSPVAVAGLTDAVELSLGNAHGCARRATGGVVCWGANGAGQVGDRSTTARSAPVAVATITNATSISAGFDHSCASTSAGSVLCWGANVSGQLGNGTMTAQLAPVAVSGISNAREVRTGRGFTCARLATNAVSCWGINDAGQLGNGTTTTRSTPAAVLGITDAAALTVGQQHACVRRVSGTVSCWGANGTHELGNGLTTNSATPTAVVGVRNAIEVASRYAHTCVRRATGGVSCWGPNSGGVLGDGVGVAGGVDRVGVAATHRVVQVAGGERHGCARRSTGEVLCWGANINGQIGDGTTTSRPEPVLVSSLSDAVSLAVGGSHTCALRADRTVACWGLNADGQLGDGSNTDRSAPVAVRGIDDAVQLVVGARHTCARRASGAVFCWGANALGQLGDGTTDARSAPVEVAGLRGAIELAAGQDHSCASRLSGDVVCWGSNDHGQLGDGTTTSRAMIAPVSFLSGAVELAAGLRHSCARLGDGTVRCWGANALGQLGDGRTVASSVPVATVLPMGVRFVALTSGALSTCARDAAGLVYCWGDNTRGQMGESAAPFRTQPRTPSIAPTNFVEAASGVQFHFARPASGSISSWGEGTSGQLADGSMITRYVPVTTVGINN
jgi:alpha-tubulin suppressor-like RCC1 family protein